jgi:RNA polymerase sigma-70 factor (ECF subfamily)
MLTEADLIKGCKDLNRLAQKELYERYCGKMRSVCQRYSGNSDEAQDILQEGFIKIFSNINKFSGNGSLEGWIKRIIINTAITSYHKSKKLNSDSIHDHNIAESVANIDGEDEDDELSIINQANLSKEELMDALQILSEAYRIVFNMYYIESYSHKEISDLLGIDEKTSRTRLFRGRQQLQKYLNTFCSEKVRLFSNQVN